MVEANDDLFLRDAFDDVGFGGIGIGIGVAILKIRTRLHWRRRAWGRATRQYQR